MWTYSFHNCHIDSRYLLQLIAPIFKGGTGSKLQPPNYRPVSLTSHVVKIFERVIQKKDDCLPTLKKTSFFPATSMDSEKVAVVCQSYRY